MLVPLRCTPLASFLLVHPRRGSFASIPTKSPEPAAPFKVITTHVKVAANDRGYAIIGDHLTDSFQNVPILQA